MPTWPQFASIEVTDITTHHRDRKSTVLVKTNRHTGTHTDAPIHYSETGKHLGEIPLADLVGTGLVIDLRPITRPWSYYSLDDVLGCVPAGEEIRQGDVVVLYTGWDQYNWTKPTRDDVMYFDRHPGPKPEVIDYLIDEKKIKWLGPRLAANPNAKTQSGRRRESWPMRAECSTDGGHPARTRRRPAAACNYAGAGLDGPQPSRDSGRRDGAAARRDGGAVQGRFGSDL